MLSRKSSHRHSSAQQQEKRVGGPIQLHVLETSTEHKKKRYSHLAHKKRTFAHWPYVRSFASVAQMRTQNTPASYHDKQQCSSLTHSTRLPNHSSRLTLRALRRCHGLPKTTSGKPLNIKRWIDKNKSTKIIKTTMGLTRKKPLSPVACEAPHATCVISVHSCL